MQFKCSMCGGIFKKGWSDEEARQERDLIFGVGYSDKDCKLICDDCFQKIKPISYKEARAKIRKNMADVYRRIENHTMRRLLYKINTETQKRFENLIIYGTTHPEIYEEK